ncbi:HupE/UreJ family protein [Psychrosphaera sp.]|nr:HupE/UreJ family protein [Psychrosphaera sp.]
MSLSNNKKIFLTNLQWICFIAFLSLAALFSINSMASETLNESNVTVESSKTSISQKVTPSKEMLDAMSNLNNNDRAVSDGLTNFERIEKYTKSGFVHILPLGLDHILFVLALFFSTVLFKKLFWQITAFTLAHSVTLVLSSLGFISLSGSIVEPLIALSIAWMAIDNIRNEHTSSTRLWVIVFFGLLHGLGFASVLSDFGLPQEAFLTALFAFNIGVELGQLAVLIAATAVFYWWSKKPTYRAFVQVPMSGIIAIVGLYWFFERIL